MMSDLALIEAERIYHTRWEIFEHPRPSPFALPLIAAFNPEVLVAQDREKALDEIVEALFEEWGDDDDGPGAAEVEPRASVQTK